MKRVITYGTFDLLHYGHINLLKRAKALGDYLIVAISTDEFNWDAKRKKCYFTYEQRKALVEAIRYVDLVIPEESWEQKRSDMHEYHIDTFVIGDDWEGKFDYLKEYCEVVYLPRTEGISSTMLRDESQEVYRLGIIGSGRIAHRFVPESKVVNGVVVTAVFNPDPKEAGDFASFYGIKAFSDFTWFLEQVDLVYIASPHLTHYDYVKRCLLAGKHVLCEIPFVLCKEQALELYQMAENRNLVLMEASKTAYCPAFGHVVTLVKTGIIGDVVDVKASLSKMVAPPIRELDAGQAGGAMTEHASLTLMAIIKLLGIHWNDVSFHTRVENGVDVYTKGIVNYPHATSSFTLGIGVKTEGNLVISGTKGYIYVPAPWWLTDYFEVRYEDQTKNKKFFYSYDGEGLRYEIQEFLSMIVNNRRSCYKLRPKESVAIAEIIEKYRNGDNVTRI